MSDKDFIIVDGVLTEYVGCGGDIIIPDGVKIINENAFVNPETITGISLPKSFFTDVRFLYRLSNLKQISVKKGNTIYSVIDGALINMETKELVAYPSARENSSYVTPEWIKDIHFDAFKNNRFLEKLILSEGLVELYCGLDLEGCDKITTIVLPRSLKCVGICNTDFSTNLIKQVFYKGFSAEEREASLYALGFGYGWKGDQILPDATWYYYSEERPKSKGNYWHYGEDGISIVIWDNNEETK